MSRKLIVLAAIAAASALPALAQTRPGAPNPASPPPAASRDSKPTSAELMHRIRGHVWVHMHRREFDLMEQWAAELRDPSRAEEDDTAYSFWFYQSFLTNMNPYDYDAMKTRWLSIFEDWKAKYPKSATPYLVHAALLLKRADHLRGEDAFATLPPERQLATVSAYDEAYSFLISDRASIDLMSSDYAWWQMHFLAAIKGSAGRKAAYSRMVEGLKRFPDVELLHSTGAYYSLPKWGGSWSEFNAWVEASVKATRDKHGMRMYAKIFHVAHWERPLQKLLRTSPRHWQLVKAGIADISKRPLRNDHYKMFVSLACGARDQAAFSTHWAGWQKVMTDWTEEPPMAEYCAFDEQDDRDSQTFEVVPLPKVM